METSVVPMQWHSKKQYLFVSTLFVCQLTCFLIGGLIVPNLYNINEVFVSKCLYNRNSLSCISQNLDTPDVNLTVNRGIMYTFQIPTSQLGSSLEYTRWQQYFLGVLKIHLVYPKHKQMSANFKITLDTNVGYSNQTVKDEDRKLYVTSVEKHVLNCSLNEINLSRHYRCELLKLFEVESLNHNYYIINIKIQLKEQNGKNIYLGIIKDMQLTVFNKNEDFIHMVLYIKTIFFLFIIAIMIWFLNKIRKIKHKMLFIEKIMLIIVFILTLMNFPNEFLSLYYDMPFMIFVQEIKLVLFYGALLYFLVTFSHKYTNATQINLHTSMKHLTETYLLCTLLFLVSMYDEGNPFINPFICTYMSKTVTNSELTFKGSTAAGFIFFLSYVIICTVFLKMNTPKLACSPNLKALKSEIDSYVYRLRSLLMPTLWCATITLIGFIFNLISKKPWACTENNNFNCVSSYLIGFYGMWNIYIIAVFVVYSPFLGYRAIEISNII